MDDVMINDQGQILIPEDLNQDASRQLGEVLLMSECGCYSYGYCNSYSCSECQDNPCGSYCNDHPSCPAHYCIDEECTEDEACDDEPVDYRSVYVDGEPAMAYVYDNGSWNLAIAHVYDGSDWKRGIV